MTMTMLGGLSAGAADTDSARAAAVVAAQKAGRAGRSDDFMSFLFARIHARLDGNRAGWIRGMQT